MEGEFQINRNVESERGSAPASVFFKNGIWENSRVCADGDPTWLFVKIFLFYLVIFSF